jgi:hypothetical protein
MPLQLTLPSVTAPLPDTRTSLKSNAAPLSRMPPPPLSSTFTRSSRSVVPAPAEMPALVALPPTIFTSRT